MARLFLGLKGQFLTAQGVSPGNVCAALPPVFVEANVIVSDTSLTIMVLFLGVGNGVVFVGFDFAIHDRQVR